jgi:hypothetical protein
LFGGVSDVDPANEKELADAAEVSGDAAEEAAEGVAAAVAAVVGAEESRKKANAAAKAYMLLLVLGPNQRTQLLNLHGGVQMWADLHVQFAQWQEARGPALQRQYEVFKPRETETVAAV